MNTEKTLAQALLDGAQESVAANDHVRAEALVRAYVMLCPRGIFESGFASNLSPLGSARCGG